MAFDIFKTLKFGVAELTPFFTMATLDMSTPLQVLQFVVKFKDNQGMDEVDESVAGVFLLALFLVSCGWQVEPVEFPLETQFEKQTQQLLRLKLRRNILHHQGRSLLSSLKDLVHFDIELLFLDFLLPLYFFLDVLVFFYVFWKHDTLWSIKIHWKRGDLGSKLRNCRK